MHDCVRGRLHHGTVDGQPMRNLPADRDRRGRSIAAVLRSQHQDAGSADHGELRRGQGATIGSHIHYGCALDASWDAVVAGPPVVRKRHRLAGHLHPAAHARRQGQSKDRQQATHHIVSLRSTARVPRAHGPGMPASARAARARLGRWIVGQAGRPCGQDSTNSSNDNPTRKR